MRVVIENIFKFWSLSQNDFYICTRLLSGRKMLIFREIRRVQEEIFDLEQLSGVIPPSGVTPGGGVSTKIRDVIPILAGGGVRKFSKNF